jgi:hypothetical protein
LGTQLTFCRVTSGFRDEARYQKSLSAVMKSKAAAIEQSWKDIPMPSAQPGQHRPIALSVECAESMKFLIRKGISNSMRPRVRTEHIIFG